MSAKEINDRIAGDASLSAEHRDNLRRPRFRDSADFVRFIPLLDGARRACARAGYFLLEQSWTSRASI
jgi:hypothetical protein